MDTTREVPLNELNAVAVRLRDAKKSQPEDCGKDCVNHSAGFFRLNEFEISAKPCPHLINAQAGELDWSRRCAAKTDSRFREQSRRDLGCRASPAMERHAGIKNTPAIGEPAFIV
jgi:hypothetical protein